jgi:GNAT superfamily N-acetyltransferase
MVDCIPEGYTIRPASISDLKYLNKIELAAARIFPVEAISEEIRNQALPLELLESAQAEGRLFVAANTEDEPVGFIALHIYDDGAFIIELDVHPSYHRKGLGKVLIMAAADWAILHECSALTLTTFSAVQWNAPYYERLGFKRLRAFEIGKALSAQLEEEASRGLKDRVAMRMDLNERYFHVKKDVVKT